MPGPLDGVRVVDLTSVAMGPYATALLGDMGADIIKVESPEGDMFRYAAPARNRTMGAPFLNLNRNKRSIVLDLKVDADLRALKELLAKADVFICSLRPHSLRKLGLDSESLAPLLPRLIHCGAYGFSEAGPYAGRPAYDDIIQAMSGQVALEAHGEEVPTFVNTIMADKTTALTAVYAISAALYEREHSGRGQAVEVPMFETMVAFNLQEHLGGETFRPANGPMGYDRVLTEHRRPHKTKDGYIGLLPYTNTHWERFFEIAGRPDLAADPRFADPIGRSRNANELYRYLGEAIAGRTTAEWVELLSTADIPVTPVMSLEEVLRDPHLKATEFFREDTHSTEGPIRTMKFPVNFSRTPASVRRLAPGLGEHREEILRDLETQLVPPFRR